MDETWLFRVEPEAPVVERVRGTEGIVHVAELDARYAIVQTCAVDAIAREKVLRALHAKLGERPLAQLHRPLVAPSKRPSREEWTLVRAWLDDPSAGADALAKASGLPAKSARERMTRLAKERVVVLEAEPTEAPLAHALVRASPSSTAAASRAFDAIEGVVRAWLPTVGETTHADALVVGKPDLAPARDVPGIASVDLLPVRASWRDDAFVDALLKRS